MNKLKKCRHGEMVYQPNDRYIGRSLELYGEFSEGEVDLFRRLVKPGDTVLDVGANIGAHTVPLARFAGPGGQVLAFEPQRITFYSLCASVALNNLSIVHCHRAALGAAPGSIQVPELDPDAEQNFGGLELKRHHGGACTVEVPLWTIDTLGLKRCDFIKVDVEGMETEVLTGATATLRTLRPLLYVEDDRKERSAALRELLTALGYELYFHRPPLYNPANVAGNATNVFGRIVSINLYCHPRELPSPVNPRDFALEKVGPPRTVTAVTAGLPDPLALAEQAQQAGNLARAEELCRLGLAAGPGTAAAWSLLGGVCWQQGKLDDAIAAYREAVRLAPDDTASLNGLGAALARQDQAAEAVRWLRRAVGLRPEFAEAHSNLGNALRSLGQQDEAAASYREAIRLHPAFADAWYNLGTLLRKQAQDAQALDCFRATVRLQPAFAEAHHNLGNVLRDLGRREEATTHYREAVRLRPDFASGWFQLGNMLHELGQLGEARGHLEQALRLRPEFAEAHNNLGNLLQQSGDMEEAAGRYREALRLRPDLANTHTNLGNVLKELGQFDEAMRCYQETLRLQPEHVEAHLDRALLWLLQGDFARGLAEYEWRWRSPDVPPRSFPQPWWDGSALEGRTILLHAEQGLGDTLQFVRYAPLVKQRGGIVLLLCPKALHAVLAGVAGVERVLALGEPLPAFDVHAPLMSLPRLLGTTPATIPAPVPYLRADAQLVRRWHDELATLTGCRVGIVWEGSASHRRNYLRSAPLARFEPLARVPGVSLVSLQKGPASEQAGQVGFSVLDLSGRLDEQSGHFMDTAAVLASLDLLVSVDTAVVHLGGALGVATWVALGVAPDWRWQLGREDSPWYPSLRLFRQARFGDWDDIFQRIAAALHTRVTQSGINPR